MFRPARNRLLWVLGFLVLTLAVVYAVFVYLYSSYKDQLEDELGQRLVAVATASAAAVNGEVWSLLAAEDSVAVAGVLRELNEVQRQTGVSNIILFDRQEATVFDLGGQYVVGDPNLALTADVEEVATALAGLPATTELFSSQGVYLKSAYAPVFSATGDIIGGVGVDGSATFFEVLTRVRRTLVVSAVLVLVGMAILGFGFAKLLVSEEGLQTRLRRTETLATMGQMAAMLAHEIRNPLGIIRGAAERIGTRYKIEDDEMFRFIPEEVDRLERTLGAYLDFARPGRSGEVEDVGRALERTLELVGHELERKGITLEMERVSGEVPVRGDPHLLQQAFLNLVLNARDALPEGGTLRVLLQKVSGRARVVFSDNGPGMTEEVRRRATEPFFTSKEKGSGLGLAVVHRVVNDLRGRMEIESGPGKGTKITLSFPMASPGKTEGGTR